MKRFALLLALGGCATEELAAVSTIRDARALHSASTIREVVERAPRLQVADHSCNTLSWPVSAPVSSGFGRRDGRPHEGIDLAVPEGTPVGAACDGVVVHAGNRLRGYGNLVLVNHGGGLVTVYAHNRSLEVKEGDRVARGQMVARSGQTGRASAPHLHFEVRRDNHPEDPLLSLANGRTNFQARRANP